ncbi:hypothetical protein KCP75_07585 [Salmonella enterica subsp. enterica]|nr:hypothetical protein KCP75_07585 [Salmonella enterica subsp. enterica]
MLLLKVMSIAAWQVAIPNVAVPAKINPDEIFFLFEFFNDGFMRTFHTFDHWIKCFGEKLFCRILHLDSVFFLQSHALRFLVHALRIPVDLFLNLLIPDRKRSKEFTSAAERPSL